MKTKTQQNTGPMSSREVAQLALQATAMLAALTDAGDRNDADEAPSLVELWASHFVDSELRRDYMIDNYLRRADTSTALFEHQLEALLTKLYDRKYPALKARTFLPPPAPIPAGAETVSSIGYDMKGEATLLSSYGEDIKRVELDGVKSTWNIIGIAAAWAITIQQARAAAMAGMPLDARGIAAARWLVERKIDDLLATGDASAGLDGFLTLTTGAGGVILENKAGDLAGDWDVSTTAATSILDDFGVIIANFEAGGVHVADSCILDTPSWTRMTRLQINSTSSTTVIEFLTEKYGLTFDRWTKADTADSAGTGPRAVIYAKSDEVVSPIISVEPEILPSVWKGTQWETVLHARCGGVRVENSQGILYADHHV